MGDRWAATNTRRQPGLEQAAKTLNHLFTHAGIFLAFSFPGFFLSTRRGSLVTQPASGRISQPISDP